MHNWHREKNDVLHERRKKKPNTRMCIKWVNDIFAIGSFVFFLSNPNDLKLVCCARFRFFSFLFLLFALLWWAQRSIFSSHIDLVPLSSKPARWQPSSDESKTQTRFRKRKSRLVIKVNFCKATFPWRVEILSE